MIKKIFKFMFFYVLLISILTACKNPWEKKFDDYPNTIWISEEPYVEIIVDKDGTTKAKIEDNNQIIDAELDTRANVIRCSSVKSSDSFEEIIFFRGSYNIKEDKCIIEVKKREKDLFNDEEKIILNRKKKNK